jgi:uncharacterized membrane protein YecN with MAPEG domain
MIYNIILIIYLLGVIITFQQVSKYFTSSQPLHWWGVILLALTWFISIPLAVLRGNQE